MGMDRQALSVDLVDQDSQSQGIIQSILQAMGEEIVLTAYQSYDAAIEGLLHYTPELLIVEIGLPQGNGMEFIRKIRMNQSDVCILVYSSQDEQLYAERALRVGAHGYVMKEDDTFLLQSALQALLQGDLFVSPAIETKILRTIARTGAEDEPDPERLLSNRELEIFVKIGEGMSSRAIAEQLGLSIKTIETHRAHIKRKLSSPTGTNLIRFAKDWVSRINLSGVSSDT